ncbi:RIP metalloprotease RseP [Ichthyobacterium seriolicida]|uniref:Zinc metalloprotease n=1 Tax=Ichthyobacterium seriolicida TaxID=242600 RepID=A0A1J1DZP1_9FLAO|nr:RIP metalloprotease RseP [Ichthyobacterium seriolicida]BAV95369.1 membrane-associated zinc metalloprotease [Ichthyobacterium seriolicida]
MEEVLIKGLQFFLSISILVIFHELGHFIPAKLFGTKVEKFYLFFDPWFSLFKKKIGGTEYGIGWLPMGGYVKIAGMVDESMDLEQLKQEPRQWEFRSKPAWQRLIIMVGGVTVNLILAGVIYSGIAYTWGDEYLPVKNIEHGFLVDSLGREIGFENGDKVISIDGVEPISYMEMSEKIVLGAKEVTVLRNDNEIKTINIKPSHIKHIIKNPLFLKPDTPAVIDKVMENSPAEKAGIQRGDKILTINGESTVLFSDIIEELRKKSTENDLVNISVLRDNNTLDFNVNPDNGVIGIKFIQDLTTLKTETKKYSLIESIPAGMRKGYERLNSYISQFKIIFSTETEAYKSVGGFLSIAKQFPSTWNWHHFWSFTAFFSLMLAFLNILPIPVLDGGHVVFVLYEMITRRPPNQKVLEYAQIAGFAIVLFLFIFANINDVIKIFFS